MARKKIREYDSKSLLKEHFKRISGSDLEIKSAQVTESTDFSELVDKEAWLSSTKLVVKPDMLFGKRGKSGLVALKLDLAGVASFVKERLGKDHLCANGRILYTRAMSSTCGNPSLGDLDFTFLEMNPFTLVDGKPYPLDMRGELDDTATFKNFKKWGNIEFPLPFGRVMSPTESFIHGLDEKMSASLKFTVLNPKGRIWTMVAGGGASVIYADTVGDLGFTSELGNYAEYSGAPNEEEVLELLLMRQMHLYVRRGGPNYQRGLAKMRTLAEEVGIPIEVYGPEATMTGICKQAIE
ncbi:hypothetical protein RD792_008401 [Penstemon davidsonii]|uniref:ATP citrate synthase n=1 Tax=Penstemon davidsonii TaxID=160366 RepID=A0ABR0D9U7_9LAMI|nr:hypothetical protein RD792_008401 [Penstemon davidsonii]